MESNRKAANKSKPIEKLVLEYAKYASQHGKATEAGEYKKCNKALDKLVPIYRQIKEQGNLTHPLFKELLHSSDRGVKLWAATHSFAISQKEAEVALDALRNPRDFIGLSAFFTLMELRRGILKLDE